MDQNFLPPLPTVRPTEKEFSNFQEYTEKLDKLYSKDYGGVRVIPPKGYNPRTQGYDEEIENTLLKGPIEQNAYGKGGIYELLYIQKKSLTIKEYKKKVQCFQAITEKKSIDQIEEMFWKNISFSPPLYGADISGSFMDQGVPWNLNELNSIMNYGLKTQVLGVNYPYLYVGCWKSMFGWHTEDLDLYSINYLHYGKPKFWYCIPRADKEKLEQVAKKYFAEGFSKCSEFLRHKTVMINPYLIKNQVKDIRIFKTVHNPGEFVITFGGAYHAGFNIGFNIAEAVNFACLKWLDMYINVKTCNCLKDSVKISKEEFLENIQKSKFKDTLEVKEYKRKLLGIAQEENQSKQKNTLSKSKSKSKSQEHDYHVEKQIQLDIIEKKQNQATKQSRRKNQSSSTTEIDDFNTGRKIIKLNNSQNNQISIKISPLVAKNLKLAMKQTLMEKDQIKTRQRMKQNIQLQNLYDQIENNQNIKDKYLISKKNNLNLSEQNITSIVKHNNKKQNDYIAFQNLKEIEDIIKNREFNKLEIDTWIQCDICKKWRKVCNDLYEKHNKQNFECSMIKKMNCKQPEENWQNEYFSLSIK